MSTRGGSTSRACCGWPRRCVDETPRCPLGPERILTPSRGHPVARLPRPAAGRWLRLAKQLETTASSPCRSATGLRSAWNSPSACASTPGRSSSSTSAGAMTLRPGLLTAHLHDAAAIPRRQCNLLPPLETASSVRRDPCCCWLCSASARQRCRLPAASIAGPSAAWQPIHSAGQSGSATGCSSPSTPMVKASGCRPRPRPSATLSSSRPHARRARPRRKT